MARKKLTFTIDLSKIESFKGLSSTEKSQIMEDAKDFLKEQILADIDNGLSSVSGRRWKGLSPEYAREKRGQSSNVKANLELTGAMLDSFDVKIEANKLEAGFFGKEAEKADGHNNHSGKSKLPLRQSIPKKNQNFRKGILEELKEIILDTKEGLEGVE